MGLAASQARLLSLTARMHDIEYKAQKLEAQKLQMANKSQQVYQEYENALNKTTVQFRTIGTDGSAYYKDATVKSLIQAASMGSGEAKANYLVHNIATNQMYVTFDHIQAFLNAVASGDKNNEANYKKDNNGEFVGADGKPLADQTKWKEEGVFIGADENGVLRNFANYMGGGTDEFPVEEQFATGYYSLFKEMQEAVQKNGGDATKAFIAVDLSSGDYTATYPADADQAEKDAIDAEVALKNQYKPTADMAEQFANTTYLTNMIQEGFIVLHKLTGDNVTAAAEEVNIAVDPGLQEVANEADLKKAEAKYEADMAKINAKDKKFDTDIAALEQERNAIKTEMETLKTVAKDNVERTFKLFS